MERNKFVNDSVKANGKFKTWEQITCEFEINKNLYFKWIQLVHPKLNYWENTLTESATNSQSLSYLNHHLIKNNQIHFVEKLTMKKL